MKALTGKFTPLQQWLYTDAREVYGADCGNWGVQSDRYDGVRICIGDQALEELKQLRVFMIGCGAIGCEMLKNMALIGVGSGSRGQIQVTDDDHIEKRLVALWQGQRCLYVDKSYASNLSRFRDSLHKRSK